jgi:hypothetical protein
MGVTRGESYFAPPAVLAAGHDTPLMISGVGVGPLATPETRSMTRAMFDLALAATVRNEESLHEVESLGLRSGSVKWRRPCVRPGPPSEADVRAAETAFGSTSPSELLFTA